MFQVIKLSDLARVIEHFNNYPLKTQKYADFLLFKRAFDLVNNKEHLTEGGLRKLISIRASINKGLPTRIGAAFLNITPVPRPLVPKATLELNSPEVKQWMAGFVSAEPKLILHKTHE